VNHVRIAADRSFGEVETAFERPLGLFDPVIYKDLVEDGDPGGGQRQNCVDGWAERLHGVPRERPRLYLRRMGKMPT
jgi:hypothetical protein